jgi:hypothetical protein
VCQREGGAHSTTLHGKKLKKLKELKIKPRRFEASNHVYINIT